MLFLSSTAKEGFKLLDQIVDKSLALFISVVILGVIIWVVRKERKENREFIKSDIIKRLEEIKSSLDRLHNRIGGNG